MAGFIKRYRQAWTSWVYWPPFRAMVRVMGIGLFLELLFTRMDYSEIFNGHRHITSYWGSYLQAYLRLPVAFTAILLVVAVPILIVWRIKKQMTDWRSALMPDFRLPHLLVAATIATLIFVVMICVPAALDVLLEYDTAGWWSSDFTFPYGHYQLIDNARLGIPFLDWEFWSAVVEIALILFLTALIGLVTTWAAPLLTVALVIGGGILNSWSGLDNRLGLTRLRYGNEHDFRTIGNLLVADICLLAVLCIRVARIRPGQEPMQADERVPWLSRLLVGGQSLSPGGWMAAGLWGRVRHRRLIGLGHRFIWLVAAYLAVVVAVIPLIYSGGHFLDRLDYAFAALFMASVVSALAVGLIWPQRFAALREVELLRPSERGIFVKEIALAMLCDMAEISVVSILAMLAPVAYWSPWAFSSPVFWGAVAAAMLSEVLVFGVIFWVMRRQSPATSMVALFLAVLAVTVLIVQAIDDKRVIPALAAAAIGIVLCADAYRRWLRADVV